MFHTRIIVYLLSVILLLTEACSQPDGGMEGAEDSSNWKFYSQPLPGSVPVIFLPGVISSHRNERDFAISPDGRTILYSYTLPEFVSSALITLQYDGQAWSDPEIAPFSGEYKDLEPAFSPDGSRLFFISQRPVSSDDSATDWNIWYTDRLEGGWDSPHLLGSPVSSDGNEFYPSVAANGNLYLTIAGHPGSLGGEDIYFCPFQDGKYSDPINLGKGVNGPGPEFNAHVSPDEQFILFSSFGRDDDLGGGDLYIAYKNETGTWESAKNLGPSINSAYLDYCPLVTPDGGYLFFTSQRVNPMIEDYAAVDLKGLQMLEDNYGNGNGDIYWVEFDQLTWK